MKLATSVGVLTVLTCLSAPTLAFTGNDLRNWGLGYAGGGAVDWKSGSYLGYVSAVSDSFNDTAFCLPMGSTYQQIGAVVMKWLNENPEHWEKAGSFLVIEALKKAYPCPKKK